MLTLQQLNQYIEAVLRAKGISARVQKKLEQSNQYEIYYQPMQKLAPAAFLLDNLSYFAFFKNPQLQSKRRVCFLFEGDLGQYRVVLIEQTELNSELAKSLAEKIQNASDNKIEVTPQLVNEMKALYKNTRCVVLVEGLPQQRLDYWNQREMPVWRDFFNGHYGNPQIQSLLIGDLPPPGIVELIVEFLTLGNLKTKIDPTAMKSQIDLVASQFKNDLSLLKTAKSTEYNTVMDDLGSLVKLHKLIEYTEKLHINLQQDSLDKLQEKKAAYQTIKKQINDKSADELKSDIQQGKLPPEIMMPLMCLDNKDRIPALKTLVTELRKATETVEVSLNNKINDLTSAIASFNP